MSGRRSPSYQLGEFLLEPDEHRLTCKGNEVPLRPKNFDVLLFLVEHHHHLVSKEVLLSAVWPDSYVAEGTLRSCLWEIREALGDHEEEQRFIKTVPKIGYHFVGQVKETQSKIPPTRARIWQALLAVTAGAALLILLWQWRSPMQPESRPPSIAVLPFDNLSPVPEDEYFSIGMTEEIIAHLSKIGNLRVVSRTSVMSYKDTEKVLREIAEELGVTAILEGSARQAGGRVRITAQLIDAETDKHLWGETYDRDHGDIFEIQSDVARQIAAALQAELTPAEKDRIERKPTESLAAYNLYLQGRFLRREETGQSFRTAVERLERAIELDPDFAEAYALLAQCYFLAGEVIPDRFEKAEVAVNKALELNPNLPEAYASLGSIRLFGDWDWGAADRAYTKAAELGPHDPNALRQYGVHLYRSGRLEAAVLHLQTAQELDPLWQIIPSDLAATYIRKGVFDKAMEVCQEMLELDPSEPEAHSVKGRIYLHLSEYEKAEAAIKKALETPESWFGGRRRLIVTYLNQGRIQEAEATAHRFLDLRPNSEGRIALVGLVASWAGDYTQARTYYEKALQNPPETAVNWWRNHEFPCYTYLGHALWKLGDQAAAEEWLSKRHERDHQWLEDGDESYLSPLGIAYVHSVRGEKEEALRWLQEAITKGWVQYGQALKNPLFENLREEPRFQQMMAEVKIKADAMLQRVEEIEREWDE